MNTRGLSPELASLLAATVEKRMRDCGVPADRVEGAVRSDLNAIFILVWRGSIQPHLVVITHTDIGDEHETVASVWRHTDLLIAGVKKKMGDEPQL